MKFVLDTDVVSELRKVRLGKSDMNLAAWAQSVDAADLFVSAITIMELELGVLSIERKHATQGAMLRSWLEQHVLPEFSGRTLPVPDKHGECRPSLSQTRALTVVNDGKLVIVPHSDSHRRARLQCVKPSARDLTANGPSSAVFIDKIGQSHLGKYLTGGRVYRALSKLRECHDHSLQQ